MEWENFGNVEPMLSEKMVRQLELAAEQKERAAIAIQKVERGRQCRRQHEAGLGSHSSKRQDSAATATQPVRGGGLKRTSTKTELEQYRDKMTQLATDG